MAFLDQLKEIIDEIMLVGEPEEQLAQIEFLFVHIKKVKDAERNNFKEARKNAKQIICARLGDRYQHLDLLSQHEFVQLTAHILKKFSFLKAKEALSPFVPSKKLTPDFINSVMQMVLMKKNETKLWIIGRIFSVFPADRGRTVLNSNKVGVSDLIALQKIHESHFKAGRITEDLVVFLSRPSNKLTNQPRAEALNQLLTRFPDEKADNIRPILERVSTREDVKKIIGLIVSYPSISLSDFIKQVQASLPVSHPASSSSASSSSAPPPQHQTLDAKTNEALQGLRAKVIRRGNTSDTEINAYLDDFRPILIDSLERINVFREILARMPDVEMTQFRADRVTGLFLDNIFFMHQDFPLDEDEIPEFKVIRIAAAVLLINKADLGEDVMIALVKAIDAQSDLNALTELNKYFSSTELNQHGEEIAGMIIGLECAPDQNQSEVIKALLQDLESTDEKMTLLGAFCMLETKARTVEVAQALHRYPRYMPIFDEAAIDIDIDAITADMVKRGIVTLLAEAGIVEGLTPDLVEAIGRVNLDEQEAIVTRFAQITELAERQGIAHELLATDEAGLASFLNARLPSEPQAPAPDEGSDSGQAQPQAGGSSSSSAPPPLPLVPAAGHGNLSQSQQQLFNTPIAPPSESQIPAQPDSPSGASSLSQPPRVTAFPPRRQRSRPPAIQIPGDSSQQQGAPHPRQQTWVAPPPLPPGAPQNQTFDDETEAALDDLRTKIIRRRRNTRIPDLNEFRSILEYSLERIDVFRQILAHMPHVDMTQFTKDRVTDVFLDNVFVRYDSAATALRVAAAVLLINKADLNEEVMIALVRAINSQADLDALTELNKYFSSTELNRHGEEIARMIMGLKCDPDQNQGKVIKALLQNLSSTDEKMSLLREFCPLKREAKTVDVAQALNRYPHADKRDIVTKLANAGIIIAGELAEILVEAVFRVSPENRETVAVQFRATAVSAVAPAADREGVARCLNLVTDSANKTADVVQMLRDARNADERKGIVALANEGFNTVAKLQALIAIAITVEIKNGSSCSFEDATTVAAETQADLDLIGVLQSLLNTDARQVKKKNISNKLLMSIFDSDIEIQNLRASIVCKLFQKNVERNYVEDILSEIKRNEGAFASPSQWRESLQTLLFLVEKLPFNNFKLNAFIERFSLFRKSFAIDDAARKHLRETLFLNVSDELAAKFLFYQFTSVKDDPDPTKPSKRNLSFAFRLNSHFHNADDPHPLDTCRIIAYSIENNLGFTDDQCRQIAVNVAKVKEENKSDYVITCIVEAAGSAVRTRAIIALANQKVKEDGRLTPAMIAFVTRMHDKGVTFDDAAVIAAQVVGDLNAQKALNALINRLSVDWLKPQYVTAELVKQVAEPYRPSKWFGTGAVQEQEEQQEHSRRIDKAAELVQAMYAKGFSQSFIQKFLFLSCHLHELTGLQAIVNECSLPQLVNLLKTKHGDPGKILRGIFSSVYKANPPGSPDQPVMQAKASALQACLEKGVELTKIKKYLRWRPARKDQISLIEHYTTLSFMFRYLPISACTKANLKILMKVAGNTPQERQRVRILLFSGVEEDRCVTILAEFAELTQAYRTQSAALRIKESIHEDQLSEEQGYKLYFIRKAIKRPKSYLNEAKCSELAKAFMQIDKQKRTGTDKDKLYYLNVFNKVAHDGAETQKIALTVKLINELANDVNPQKVNVAYAMMQKGVDMKTAIKVMLAHHGKINALESVVNHLAYGANVSLITDGLLTPAAGVDIDDDQAQVLAALISHDPNSLKDEAHLKTIITSATNANRTAVLKILAHHLNAADLCALSLNTDFVRLSTIPNNQEVVLNTLLKDMSSSEEKLSLLELFIQIDATQNLNRIVAQAFNREKNYPDRLNQVLWMSQYFVPVPNYGTNVYLVTADDLSAEKLNVLTTFSKDEIERIRNVIMTLPGAQRTIEVLKAISRYRDASPEHELQRKIVWCLAEKNITTEPGLGADVMDFLSTPQFQFIDPSGVPGVPLQLIQSFANITPPENRTLGVLKTLSRASAADLPIITRLASGDHPNYSTQAIERFKKPLPTLPGLNDQSKDVLARTGDNYDRVFETLQRLPQDRRSLKLVEQIAKFGGLGAENESKRGAIVRMAKRKPPYRLEDDKITNELIAIIAEIDPGKQKEAITAYQKAKPVKQAKAISFFAQAHPPKPEHFHSMLVDLVIDDKSPKSSAGRNLRELCQTPKNKDPELEDIQNYFNITRRHTKNGVVTEHKISEALPKPEEGAVSALVMHLPDGHDSKVVLSAENFSRLELQSDQYDEHTAQKFVELLTKVLGAKDTRLSFQKEDLLNPKLKVELNLGGGQIKKVPFVVLLILIAYKKGCVWFNIGDEKHSFVKEELRKGEFLSAEDKCLQFLGKKLEQDDGRNNGWTSDSRGRLMEAAEEFAKNPDALRFGRP